MSKNCDLRQPDAEQLARSADAFQVARIVQRGQLNAILDPAEYSSVMRTECVNRSPPCTTRCPTACRSATLLTSPMPEPSEVTQRRM